MCSWDSGKSLYNTTSQRVFFFQIHNTESKGQILKVNTFYKLSFKHLPKYTRTQKQIYEEFFF